MFIFIYFPKHISVWKGVCCTLHLMAIKDKHQIMTSFCSSILPNFSLPFLHISNLKILSLQLANDNANNNNNNNTTNTNTNTNTNNTNRIHTHTNNITYNHTIIDIWSLYNHTITYVMIIITTRTGTRTTKYFTQSHTQTHTLINAKSKLLPIIKFRQLINFYFLDYIIVCDMSINKI